MTERIAFAQVFRFVWDYWRQFPVHFAADVMQRMVGDGFQLVQRFSADWHANNPGP